MQRDTTKRKTDESSNVIKTYENCSSSINDDTDDLLMSVELLSKSKKSIMNKKNENSKSKQESLSR
jgi:hypothetical protein